LKLIINGEERTFAQPVKTIAQLLEHLAVPVARTAIELNGTVVEQQKIEITTLRDADRIEIVSFVGGG
jgi:thiamine biosynthesis protein ThiS